MIVVNYEILKQNKLPFSNMHIFAITDMFHLSTDLFNILNAFVSNQTNLNALNAGNLILITQELHSGRERRHFYNVFPLLEFLGLPLNTYVYIMKTIV